ncbi:MAG: PIG-L deacetylase family protein [Planctomycetota bacterium]
MDKKTILVIGAHMDDCEIGAGGLIAKAVKAGHRVVLVNVASDYSTWQTTQGREKEIRERLLKMAEEIGVEKRFLGYGYQAVPRDLDAIKRLAEVVLDVRPDITVFHNPYEPSPSDHATVGYIAERAVRDATRLLNRYPVFSQEMYCYEVYPRISLFQPDVFIDISDVIAEVVQWPAVADRIYAESPHSKQPISSWIRATVKLPPDEKTEIPLWVHGHMKYCTAAFRGCQCGARFAEAYMSLDKRPLGWGLLQQIARPQ